jgi:hypothetical protein
MRAHMFHTLYGDALASRRLIDVKTHFFYEAIEVRERLHMHARRDGPIDLGGVVREKETSRGRNFEKPHGRAAAACACVAPQLVTLTTIFVLL